MFIRLWNARSAISNEFSSQPRTDDEKDKLSKLQKRDIVISAVFFEIIAIGLTGLTFYSGCILPSSDLYMACSALLFFSSILALSTTVIIPIMANNLLELREENIKKLVITSE